MHAHEIAIDRATLSGVVRPPLEEMARKAYPEAILERCNGIRVELDLLMHQLDTLSQTQQDPPAMPGFPPVGEPS